MLTDPLKVSLTNEMNEPFVVKAYDNLLTSHDLLAESFPNENDLYWHEMNEVGKKLSLQRKNSPDFLPFLQSYGVWNRLYAEVMSEQFVKWCHVLFPHFEEKDVRETQFELSLLPKDGGHILPHADTPKKIVSLVIYLGEPQETGAFECFRHRTDPNGDFGYSQPDWDDVETVLEVPFVPNRGAFMKRANNSLHAVRPVDFDRKTLTINLIGDRNVPNHRG